MISISDYFNSHFMQWILWCLYTHTHTHTLIYFSSGGPAQFSTWWVQRILTMGVHLKRSFFRFRYIEPKNIDFLLYPWIPILVWHLDLRAFQESQFFSASLYPMESLGRGCFWSRSFIAADASQKQTNPSLKKIGLWGPILWVPIKGAPNPPLLSVDEWKGI